MKEVSYSKGVNMKRITLQELTPSELEELKFGVECPGLYSDEEKAFVYNNLFRGEDGLVYFYPLGDNSRLSPLYVD